MFEDDDEAMKGREKEKVLKAETKNEEYQREKGEAIGNNNKKKKNKTKKGERSKISDERREIR